MGKCRNYDYGMLPITQALYQMNHIFSIVISSNVYRTIVLFILYRPTLKAFFWDFISFKSKFNLIRMYILFCTKKPKKILPCKIQSFNKSHKMGVIVILFLCIFLYKQKWAVAILIYNKEMVTIILCKY